MKKLFALLLCAAMLFTLSVPAAQDTEEEMISVCAIFDDVDETDGPREDLKS